MDASQTLTLNAQWGGCLTAAQDAAGKQSYPTATLYIVATPIGNLADISLRALHVLNMVDAIACEDTRHTQPLLRTYGIDVGSGKPMLAVHQHNELEATEQIVNRLQRGERIAFVSDAGTPGVSDPGSKLVAGVRAAGYRVVPLPGASSVTTLLSVAGITQSDHFNFIGFLPTKAMERDAAVLRLQAVSSSIVMLEAPHRIEAVAKALGILDTGPWGKTRMLPDGSMQMFVRDPAGNLIEISCKAGTPVDPSIFTDTAHVEPERGIFTSGRNDPRGRKRAKTLEEAEAVNASV